MPNSFFLVLLQAVKIYFDSEITQQRIIWLPENPSVYQNFQEASPSIFMEMYYCPQVLPALGFTTLISGCFRAIARLKGLVSTSSDTGGEGIVKVINRIRRGLQFIPQSSLQLPPYSPFPEKAV